MGFNFNGVARYRYAGGEYVSAMDYDALWERFNSERTYRVGRKVIQVVPTKGNLGLWALCDDGTLWLGEFTGAIIQTEVGKRKSLNWRYISTRAIFDKINGPTISMLEAEAAAREEAYNLPVNVPTRDVYPTYAKVKARFDDASKKMLDKFEEDYRQLHKKDGEE